MTSRRYAFSVQPFLVDKTLSQQGYVTSEPFSVEKGGVKPVLFLLADLGYPPYAQTIVATRDTLAKKADVVKRFVQATAGTVMAPSLPTTIVRSASVTGVAGTTSFSRDSLALAMSWPTAFSVLALA